MNIIASQRNSSIEKLTRETYDVLIVGGGIVGSGIARDMAMRGMKVALVDQHDFAFGTSSRSTRLLHGGLRYLAQFKVGLVREASVEKLTIAQIAPHLADPLAFIFPCYAGSDYPCWQMKIGVKFYDLLCRSGRTGLNFRPSHGMSVQEVTRALPKVKTEKLAGAVRYYDGLTNDARLVIDTLRSAGKYGANIINYVQFKDAQRKGDLWQAQITDLVTGKAATVQAKTIVNATGPWANTMPHSSVKLRVTKGIHLVVDRKRLPVPDAVVMTQGKRILFVIPWGERVVLGTTDTDYSGSLDAVYADADDTNYVLKVLAELFPTANITKADIISSWAGLRPLIADPNGKPSDISRAHEILNPEPHWWDVAGGKLTTYRLIAEQATDRIVAELKMQVKPCNTANEPLLSPEEVNGISGITPPKFDQRVVKHYVEKEWAMHLDDVMTRRTSWEFYCPEAPAKAEQVAQWMAEILGWTEAEKAEQIKRYRNNSCQLRS